MSFAEVKKQITTFLREKGFRFVNESIVRCNENDGSIVIKLSEGKSIFYVKGFSRRAMEDVLLEIRFINFVSECGISVPQILHIGGEYVFTCYLENTSIIFYVMTELTGDTIIVKETYLDIASKIADIHNMKEKIQSLGQTDGKSDHQRLEEFLNNNRMFAVEFLDVGQVKHMLENHVPSNDFCLIHADLYIGNIVTRNGSFWGLIDFSDIRNGLPEDDFGKFLQNVLTSQVDNYLAKEVVETYGKTRKYQVDFKEIYISCIYHILFNFKCIGEQLDQGIKEKYRNAINFCIMEYEKYE